jgi:peptidoglycan/xylan/chitin deacetylase (PgdA/CDA1 family)
MLAQCQTEERPSLPSGGEKPGLLRDGVGERLSAMRRPKRMMQRMIRELTGRLFRHPLWLKVLRWIPFLGLQKAIFCVDNVGHAVALTLDDGPDPDVTPCVLETLSKHDVHATFFLLGKAARCDENIVAEIAARGHELANHTWEDESSAKLTGDELCDRLTRTHAVLAPTGSPIRLFRPGGGRLGWFGRVADVAAESPMGYRCVLGFVYPHDVRIGSDDAIVRYVLKHVHDGAIVILHEGSGRSGQPPRSRVVDVLERVLPELRCRGYAVMTVSELLAAGE